MTGKTHVIGGVAACAGYAATTHHYDPLALFGAGVAGALLPDICHGGSKIGRRLPMLSGLVNMLFGHRTFTHSLLFLALVTVSLWILIDGSSVAIGAFLGIGSHMVLDAATKSGIQLLYPWKITVRFPLTVRTGGVAEYGVLVGLVLVVVTLGPSMLF